MVGETHTAGSNPAGRTTFEIPYIFIDVIKLRDIINEISYSEEDRRNKVSWQRPDGTFIPVDTVHHETHGSLAGDITALEKSTDMPNVILWKKGWMQVRADIHTLHALNEFSPPNHKQKAALIDLAIKTGLKEVDWDGDVGVSKTIWSREHTLEEAYDQNRMKRIAIAQKLVVQRYLEPVLDAAAELEYRINNVLKADMITDEDIIHVCAGTSGTWSDVESRIMNVLTDKILENKGISTDPTDDSYNQHEERRAQEIAYKAVKRSGSLDTMLVIAKYIPLLRKLGNLEDILDSPPENG